MEVTAQPFDGVEPVVVTPTALGPEAAEHAMQEANILILVSTSSGLRSDGLQRFIYDSLALWTILLREAGHPRQVLPEMVITRLST